VSSDLVRMRTTSLDTHARKKSRPYIYDIKCLVLLGAPYTYDISRPRIKCTHIQPTELLLCGLQHVLGNSSSIFRYSLM
jgi:hypothetical protein